MKLAFGLLLTSWTCSVFGETPGAELGWQKDVRPALESVICVKAVTEEGARYFQPVIGRPPECPGPLPQDLLLAELAGLLADRGPLMRARAAASLSAFEGLEVNGAGQRQAEKRYREIVLQSSEVLRRVMPRLQQVLSRSGAFCPDCPGPRTFPPARRVLRSELMLYVLAYFWPVAIQPGGTVRVAMCSGNNGLAEIRPLDESLAAAAFDLAFDNWDAAGVAARTANAATGAEECRPLSPEKKLDCVRRHLKRRLPVEARFVAAFDRRIALLPEIGIVCVDCLKNSQSVAMSRLLPEDSGWKS